MSEEIKAERAKLRKESKKKSDVYSVNEPGTVDSLNIGHLGSSASLFY